jgi:flagellar biosynthesis/type III secretory pathway chaperone
MPKRSDPLKTLENLLVQEFRTCQALQSVTWQERHALTGGDVERMQSLATQKEVILDRLYSLEDARQSYLLELAMRLAPNAAEPADVALAAILSGARPQEAERLRVLQGGILALTGQVRDLTEGNHALAAYALQHAAIQQDALGEVGQSDLPALFAAVLAARQALDEGDKIAVSNAIVGMENALERLGRSLMTRPTPPEAEDAAGTPAAEPAPQRPTVDDHHVAGPSLVETMANLYRQQAAYQAVLRVSRRMLASA